MVYLEKSFVMHLNYLALFQHIKIDINNSGTIKNFNYHLSLIFRDT